MEKQYTLLGLYEYLTSKGANFTFSQTDKDVVVVTADGIMSFSSESDEGKYPVNIKMNYVGDNLNGSRIKMKAQKNALPSSPTIPILAYIHDVDGVPCFYGHNRHVENGETVYEEIPVGVICEKAHIEHDDERDLDYAVANGIIWEEYTKAAEILEREGSCSVSVELGIRSMSYDAEDKILNLDDFYYLGCTLLGVDDNGKEVKPAMPGSEAVPSTFSEVVKEDFLIETLEKLNETLSKFNIEQSKEGGKTEMNKQDKTKVADEPVVETQSVEEPTSSDTVDEGVEFSEETTEETTEEVAKETIETESVSEDSSDSEEEVAEESETSETSVNFSVEFKGKKTEFSLSLNEKIAAMTELVNATYGAEDDDWYNCEVFDNPKEVVMVGYWSGKAYRQSYKVRTGVYSLEGERVEVQPVWMTAEERQAFEDLRASFEETSDKLRKYEEEPKKMEILESAEYSLISKEKSFIEFKEMNNHFDMSIDEVIAKADEMLKAYAKELGKETKAEFSEVHEETQGRKNLYAIKKNTSVENRYGTLFSSNFKGGN